MASPHHTSLLLLLLLLFSFPLFSTSQPTTTPASAAAEKQLLLHIKAVWGNPAALAAWSDTTSVSHCNWTGIECDMGGHVNSLSINSLGVAGPVPEAIAGLKNLTVLDLGNNNLTGGFPTFLYNCIDLRHLDLSENYFSGSLPPDIDRLSPSLTYLALNGNNFDDTIPASIARIASLQYLLMGNNNFTGAIPPEIGELTELRSLTLANNPFAPGEIPASFKNLTKLTLLWMETCSLQGGIPEFLAQMPEMTWLDLSQNSLAGNIPPGIWNLNKLQTLYLYKNNLTGEIAVHGAFGATSLEDLDLSSNQLNGSIPESFGQLVKLKWMTLYFNKLSGEIPASIGKLPSLYYVRLFGNKLTGVLPPELGRHSFFWSIEVQENSLTGEIPSGLCDRGGFTSLIVSNNKMTGPIPSGLGECATLDNIMLGGNRFTGDVPSGIWKAVNLTTAIMRDNQLSGTLPAKLQWNLTRLSIQNNRFTGGIPSSAFQLQVLEAGNNFFSGVIPADIAAGMPLLNTLDLSNNRISGDIPASIGNLLQLTQLDLSGNKLAGEIPAAIGDMPDLTSLDLSSNQLSGEIPPAIARLKLNNLNLSSNHLSGEVPAALVSSAYDQSFLGNPGLCGGGDRVLTGVRTCSTGNSGGVSHALRAGLISAGAVLLVIAAATAAFVVRDIQKRKRPSDRATWKLTPFQALDFTEGVIARGLTDENVVGKGGSGCVYRIAFHGDRAVAVKRIWSAGRLDAKSEREFESEVKILGSIRHANIVKLLCCISSPESKLLVYEYMGNGSLDKWLHGHRTPLRPAMARVVSVRREPLDWPTRVRIAVGAARGLCYMHHECAPPIVHRDVKSSNILLDSEFRARIADFGLARMLVRVGTPDSVSAIAGSFGYMAPECAYTRKVSEKADVYSFGVVLLELTTGREANNGGEHGTLAEWAWRHFQAGKSIVDMIDTDIRDVRYHDDIEVVFKLGIICTGTLPSTRPSMKDVLQMLLRCEQAHPAAENEMGKEVRDVQEIGNNKGFDCIV